MDEVRKKIKLRFVGEVQACIYSTGKIANDDFEQYGIAIDGIPKATFWAAPGTSTPDIVNHAINLVKSEHAKSLRKK